MLSRDYPEAFNLSIYVLNQGYLPIFKCVSYVETRLNQGP